MYLAYTQSGSVDNYSQKCTTSRKYFLCPLTTDTGAQWDLDTNTADVIFTPLYMCRCRSSGVTCSLYSVYVYRSVYIGTPESTRMYTPQQLAASEVAGCATGGTHFICNPCQCGNHPTSRPWAGQAPSCYETLILS